MSKMDPRLRGLISKLGALAPDLYSSICHAYVYIGQLSLPGFVEEIRLTEKRDTIIAQSVRSCTSYRCSEGTANPFNERGLLMRIREHIMGSGQSLAGDMVSVDHPDRPART
jgi:hypothetical protein